MGHTKKQVSQCDHCPALNVIWQPSIQTQAKDLDQDYLLKKNSSSLFDHDLILQRVTGQ